MSDDAPQIGGDGALRGYAIVAGFGIPGRAARCQERLTRILENDAMVTVLFPGFDWNTALWVAFPRLLAGRHGLRLGSRRHRFGWVRVRSFGPGLAAQCGLCGRHPGHGHPEWRA